MDKRRTVFDFLGLRTGNIAIKSVTPGRWGSEVDVTFVYRYPPEERVFTLRFGGVRSLQWIVAREGLTGDEEAQVLTHDLGRDGYELTARLATVITEVIISYDTLTVVAQDW